MNVNVTVGAPQHVVDTFLSGIIWVNPAKAERVFATKFAGGSVLFKSDVKAFDMRWDLQTQKPATSGPFQWRHGANGWRAGTPAFGVDYAYDENNTGGSQNYSTWHQKWAWYNEHVEGFGYGFPAGRPNPWQVPLYVTSMVQYLVNEPDADWADQMAAKATAGKLYTTVEPPAGSMVELEQIQLLGSYPGVSGQLAMDCLDAANAGFNWANLRAARGHAAAFKLQFLAIGVEPYWAENLDKFQYATNYLEYARAIRALPESPAKNVKLGFFTRSSRESLWEEPAIQQGLDETLIDIPLAVHTYPGSSNEMPLDKVRFRRHVYAVTRPPCVPVGGQCTESGGTDFFDNVVPFDVPRTMGPEMYIKREKQWTAFRFGQELPVGKTESFWGVVSPPGASNELNAAMLRATHYMEWMKFDGWYDSTWTATNPDPHSYGLINDDNRRLQLTPSYFMWVELQALRGWTYVHSTTDSPLVTWNDADTGSLIGTSPEVSVYVFENAGTTKVVVLNRQDEDVTIGGLPTAVTARRVMTGDWLANNQDQPLNDLPIRFRDESAVAVAPRGITVLTLGGSTPPPPPPVALSLTGITDGQTVTEPLVVQAVPSNFTPTAVEFFIDDVSVQVENITPFNLGGGTNTPYDFSALAPGLHTLKAVAQPGDVTVEVAFTIPNPDPQVVAPADIIADFAGVQEYMEGIQPLSSLLDAELTDVNAFLTKTGTVPTQAAALSQVELLKLFVDRIELISSRLSGQMQRVRDWVNTAD